MNELNETTAAYNAALDAANEARKTLTANKQAYDLAEAETLAEGVEGKNAQERKANLETQLVTEKQVMATAESQYEDAKTELAKAEANLKNARYKARLLEGLMGGTDE